MYVDKCLDVEILNLSLWQCKTKQILKKIRAYMGSNAHEIGLSSVTKFLGPKFNTRENLYI